MLCGFHHSLHSLLLYAFVRRAETSFVYVFSPLLIWSTWDLSPEDCVRRIPSDDEKESGTLSAVLFRPSISSLSRLDVSYGHVRPVPQPHERQFRAIPARLEYGPRRMSLWGIHLSCSALAAEGDDGQLQHVHSRHAHHAMSLSSVCGKLRRRLPLPLSHVFACCFCNVACLTPPTTKPNSVQSWCILLPLTKPSAASAMLWKPCALSRERAVCGGSVRRV